MNLSQTSPTSEGESLLKQLCVRFIKAKRSLISQERLLSHPYNLTYRPARTEYALSEKEVLEIYEHPEKFQGLETSIHELQEELRQLCIQLIPYFRAIRNRSFYIEYDRHRYQFFLNEEGEIIFYIAPFPAMDA